MDQTEPNAPLAERAPTWRGLRDPSVLGLLALILGLQLFCWAGLDGYQLADSVEYMERAQALVRGEAVIDSTAIRSFGFVSVLAPVFWLADAFGVEDFKSVVGVVRLMQMLIGLALVYFTGQLAARLGGRRVGLVAALTVGINPYFLLYSVSPVSGIAAALCIALALDSLLRFEAGKRALVGGLWLGGALLMAYKTVLIALPLLGVLALIGRRKQLRHWSAACAGYGLGVVGAIGLDKLCYGEWGKSLDLYTRVNFGPLMTRLTARFGFMDAAKWFWEYADGERNEFYAAPELAPKTLLKEPNPLYYLTHLPEMVVWPLLVLFAIGVLCALLRGSRGTRIVAFLFVICTAGISMKKSMDFRLLLPLLPCIGVLCGLGWRVIATDKPALVRSARAWFAVGLVLAGLGFGQARLDALNSSRYSGYWRAMQLVDQLAAERSASDKLVVACAWHWAVYLRESANVELRKLPHQLDHWRAYDETRRQRDLAALNELDAFIAHLAVLLEHPELFAAVNARFEVVSVLYDREVYEDLGPIVVFQERSAEPTARAFFTRTLGEQPLAYIESRGLNPGRRFLPAQAGESAQPLTLLGWKFEQLPGRAHAWLSLHWMRAGALEARDFLVRPRILTELLPLPWEEQHVLGRNMLGAQAPQPGEIFSEGWPVVAAAAPFDWSQEWRPLYGAEPPGALVPGVLWLRVVPLALDGQALAPFAPVTNAGGVLVTPDELDARRRGPDGWRVSAEGFVELGPVELLSPQR